MAPTIGGSYNKAKTMNILSNRIFLFLVTLLIIGGLVYIIQYRPHHKPSPIVQGAVTGPCDSAATPQYCEIRSQALLLGTNPWNKYTYYQIRNTITSYGKNGFITADQGSELNHLLNTKYLGALGDTIKNYCRQANGYDPAKLQEFQQELQSTPVDDQMQSTREDLKRTMAGFRQAILFPNTVKVYVTTGPFDSIVQLQQYARLSNFKNMEIIGQNNYIQSSLRNCSDYLSAYSDMIGTVKLCINRAELLRGKTPDEINRICTVHGLINAYYVGVLNQMQPK